MLDKYQFFFQLILEYSSSSYCSTPRYKFVKESMRNYIRVGETIFDIAHHSHYRPGHHHNNVEENWYSR